MMGWSAAAADRRRLGTPARAATIQLVILEGLVERDESNRLVLTDLGRSVLAVLTKE
jgi:DNA topoisomerase IA